MEFLNYKNHIDNINYDNNGFAKDCNITFSKENTEGFSHISITLVKKNQEKYIYSITVKENYAGYDSIASGIVTFNYNECGITSIDNGRLFDRHDECFSVNPLQYTNLIYKSPPVE